VTVSKSQSTAVPRNDVRAAAYGIPGEYVRNNDPYEIFRVMRSAVARARAGEGPSLIEIETWRLAGHFQGDTDGYRSADEKSKMLAYDPLPLMRQRLLEEGVRKEAELDSVAAHGRAEVDAAIEFARTSPLPEPADALRCVFA
jgi:TPP-dependent pyruvate/acetoin dehydrogenase alpha subunit